MAVVIWDGDSFWRKVIVARFGELFGWESKEVRVRYGCGI